MRALSVLAVITYHNGYAWASGGFLGVDAFFVLSGYLITTLLVLEYRRTASIGLVAFWGRRIRRLLPALLVVLAFCAVYGAALLSPLEIERFRWDGLSSLLYATNWRFIASGQSYFDLFVTPSPFRHLWSLAIEEQFYLVWPVVALACLRVRRGRLDLIVGVCAAGIVASVVAMVSFHHDADPSRAYFGTDARAHALLVGALLALALVDRKPGRTRPRPAAGAARITGWLALGALVWAWSTVDATGRAYYSGGSLAYAVTVAVLIAAVVQASSSIGRFLGAQPLRGIGQISYGLYLWHWPLIVWLTPQRVGVNGNALVALRLALTFGAAVVSYHFVEQPIRHGRWWPRASRRGPVVAMVAVATLALVLSAASVGAASPPTYLAGAVGTCPQPTADEIEQARAAIFDPAVQTAPAGAPTIAVLGDSTACSLGPGLVAMRARGWRTRLGAVIGCGVVSGQVVPSADIPQIPGGTQQCVQKARVARSAATAGGVPIAVVVSGWERADIEVAGTVLPAGSRRWSHEMDLRMDDVVGQLHAGHTRLVIALTPDKTRGRLFGRVFHATPGDARSFERLDDFWRRTARRHPGDVRLVDLASRVCPGGPPCPPLRDGFEPRALDGSHYTPRGAVWVLEWLLPQVVGSVKAVAPHA